MVQTCLNRISQEVDEMDSSDQVTYEEKKHDHKGGAGFYW